MHTNNTMRKGKQAYMQTQFTTAGQGELLILLYDGALKFLKQAREKMLEKDYITKGNLISKALDVVAELHASVNQDQGGDLAQNLNNLYLLCSANLLRANLDNDPIKLDAAMNILSGLRSAYAEIVSNPEAIQAAEQIAQKRQPMSASSSVRHATTPTQSSGIGQAQARAAYGTSIKVPHN